MSRLPSGWRRLLIAVIEGPSRGARRFLERDGEIVVGRSRSSDLQLDDERVSGRHLRLLGRGEGVQVEDLGSGNGTRIDGQESQGAESVGLGHKISLGDSVLVLRRCDEESVPLEGFHLIRPLGGQIGRVYLALDPAGDPVALKLADDHLSDKDRARFRREVRLLSELAHPGIARLISGLEQPGVVGLVSEFVDGQSLEQRRCESGSLPWPFVVKLGIDAAEALAHAHARGIAHRDIKGCNIMLPNSGGVKLIDFGFAKRTLAAATADALTSEGVFIGTFAYMAPEGLQGAERLATSGDIYALGATLFECLEGRLPFSPRSWTEALELRRDPPALGLGKPPELSDILRRCMAFEEADRWQDCEVLGARLRELLGRLGPGAAQNPTMD